MNHLYNHTRTFNTCFIPNVNPNVGLGLTKKYSVIHYFALGINMAQPIVRELPEYQYLHGTQYPRRKPRKVTNPSD